MDLTSLYVICFGVGLSFALVSVFLAGFGGGHEGHVESHSDLGHAEHDVAGFSPFSPTIIGSFVTAFGGLGLIFSRLESTRSPWLSIPLSLFGGLLMATLVFVIFSRVFRATQSSSEGRVAELFGHSATVITPIAAGGVGEIAYVQGGTRYTACARAEDESALPAGEKVRIVRVAGSQFYVIKD